MIFKKTRPFVLIAAIMGIMALAGCQAAGAGDDTTVDRTDDPGTGDGGTSAAGFVILAKTAVTTTGTTAITGNVGLSPNALSDTEGFSPILDGTGTFATSPDYVTGKIYTADMAELTPTDLTAAIGDMETVYTNTAGLPDPDFIDLHAGEIGGQTLVPGLYKYNSGLSVTGSDVTLDGSDTDTWTFQISGALTVGNSIKVTLAGGALAENIVWQVGSNASLGTGSVFAGKLMTGTDIALNTDATVNGWLHAQSAVTLNASTVTQP